MHKSTGWLMLFGVTLTLLPPLNSQVERASVVGNINDKSGTTMAGVAITVTNETNTHVQSDDAYTAVT